MTDDILFDLNLVYLLRCNKPDNKQRSLISIKHFTEIFSIYLIFFLFGTSFT